MKCIYNIFNKNIYLIVSWFIKIDHEVNFTFLHILNCNNVSSIVYWRLKLMISNSQQKHLYKQLKIDFIISLNFNVLNLITLINLMNMFMIKTRSRITTDSASSKTTSQLIDLISHMKSFLFFSASSIETLNYYNLFYCCHHDSIIIIFSSMSSNNYSVETTN